MECYTLKTNVLHLVALGFKIRLLIHFSIDDKFSLAWFLFWNKLKISFDIFFSLLIVFFLDVVPRYLNIWGQKWTLLEVNVFLLLKCLEFRASSNVPAWKLIWRYTINNGHSVLDSRRHFSFSFFNLKNILRWLIFPSIFKVIFLNFFLFNYHLCFAIRSYERWTFSID